MQSAPKFAATARAAAAVFAIPCFAQVFHCRSVGAVQPTDITNREEIVGQAGVPILGFYRAGNFLVNVQVPFFPLNPLLLAINDRGDVVGQSADETASGGFLLRNG